MVNDDFHEDEYKFIEKELKIVIGQNQKYKIVQVNKIEQKTNGKTKFIIDKTKN